MDAGAVEKSVSCTEVASAMVLEASLNNVAKSVTHMFISQHGKINTKVESTYQSPVRQDQWTLQHHPDSQPPAPPTSPLSPPHSSSSTFSQDSMQGEHGAECIHSGRGGCRVCTSWVGRLPLPPPQLWQRCWSLSQSGRRRGMRRSMKHRTMSTRSEDDVEYRVA
jgi:hypothetical protein